MHTLIEGRGQEFTAITTEIVSLQQLTMEQVLGIDTVLKSREESVLTQSILDALSPAELNTYDAGATDEHVRKREDEDPVFSLALKQAKDLENLFGEIDGYSLSTLGTAYLGLSRYIMKSDTLIVALRLKAFSDNVVVTKHESKPSGGIARSLTLDDRSVAHNSLDRLHIIRDELKQV